MPRPLTLLWQALERIPQRTTERREWRLLLNDEWPVGQQYLRPTGRLVDAIACPNPASDDCPRKVVHRPDGRIRAACGDRPQRCDAIELQQDDIEELAFDHARFVTELAKLLGLNGADRHAPTNALISVGSLGVRAGLSVPFFVALPPGDTKITHLDLPMLSGSERPGAVFAPSTRLVDLPQEWSVVSLADLLGAEGNDFALWDSSEAFLDDFRNRYAARSPAVGVVMPLPAEARWEYLTFEFIAEETVLVRFRNQPARQFGPAAFGMAKRNGKPKLMWFLLLNIAAQEGQLTWQQSSAAQKIAKQKDLLSKQLRHLFGIEDDPLRYRNGAYEAAFKVVDRRPSQAPARRAH